MFRLAMGLMCLFIFCSVLPAYGPVDSLLEEAQFRLQILTEPEKAGQIYARILADYPEDAYAVERARRGLRFCQSVTGKAFSAGTVGRVDAPLQSGRDLPLLLWHRTFSSGSIQTLSENGDNLRITTGDGFLLLADRLTGNALWARGGLSGDKMPASDGSLLFAVSESGRLIALSPERGKIEFASEINGLTSAPTLGTRKVIYCASGTRALALSSKNGSQIWSVELKTTSPIYRPPVLCGEQVLYCAPGVGVLLLEGGTGNRVWASGLETSLQPLVFRNSVILVSGSEVVALSRENGKMIWNLTDRSEVISAALVEGKYVVLLANTGEIKGVDPLTGEVKFTFLASPGTILAGSDRLYNLDLHGRITCRAFDGRILWRFSTGETDGASALLQGERVYVLTENNGLFALNSVYGHAEDGRITDGLSKIDAMGQSGMYRLALNQARSLLSEIEPGNPALLHAYALLLQKNGETDKAFLAWEKYAEVAGTYGPIGAGIGEEIRALSGAAWTAVVPGAGKFTPLYKVRDNLVVLGEGQVDMIHAGTGRGVWKYRFPLTRSVPVNAVASEGELFFCGESGVSAISLDAQRSLWKTPLSCSPTALAVVGNQLAVGTWNQGLIILDVKSGKIVRKLFPELKALFPLSSGGSLFCVGLEGVLAGLRDNRILFRLLSEDRFLAMPQVARSTLVIPTAQGYLNAFSSRDGALLWSERIGVQSSALTIDEARVYALFSNQMAAAFNLRDGTRMWAMPAPGESPEMLANAEGVLAIAGGDKIILCRKEDGEVVKVFRTAGRISSILMNGSALFARLENGLLYRFEY